MFNYIKDVLVLVLYMFGVGDGSELSGTYEEDLSGWEDGSAYDYANGTTVWYLNGKRQRDIVPVTVEKQIRKLGVPGVHGFIEDPGTTAFDDVHDFPL